MWLLAVAGIEDGLMRGRVPHSQLVACVCVCLAVLDLSVVFFVLFLLEYFR